MSNTLDLDLVRIAADACDTDLFQCQLERPMTVWFRVGGNSDGVTAYDARRAAATAVSKLKALFHTIGWGEPVQGRGTAWYVQISVDLSSKK